MILSGNIDLRYSVAIYNCVINPKCKDLYFGEYWRDYYIDQLGWSYTDRKDWTYCVGDQMTSASVSSVTAADRITAWTNLRASLQSVYGNATTRTKLDTYLNSSEAGFDTTVINELMKEVAMGFVDDNFSSQIICQSKITENFMNSNFPKKIYKKFIFIM